MKLLLDMNVSTLWLDVLHAAGIEATHWSDIGHAAAADEEIMRFAIASAATVFTLDLDFGILLARSWAGLYIEAHIGHIAWGGGAYLRNSCKAGG